MLQYVRFAWQAKTENWPRGSWESFDRDVGKRLIVLTYFGECNINASKNANNHTEFIWFFFVLLCTECPRIIQISKWDEICQHWWGAKQSLSETKPTTQSLSNQIATNTCRWILASEWDTSHTFVMCFPCTHHANHNVFQIILMPTCTLCLTVYRKHSLVWILL